MTGIHTSPASAEQLLDDMFGGGGSRQGGAAPTLLLVDEMDLLLTRNQRVRQETPFGGVALAQCLNLTRTLNSAFTTGPSHGRTATSSIRLFSEAKNTPESFQRFIL